MLALLSVFKLVQTSISRGMFLLDKWTKPNSKYIKDPLQFEMSAIRNKVIILIQLFSFLIYIIDAIINTTSFKSDFVRWSMSIAICCVLLFSCRYHHEIFNIFYTLTCLSYGPSIMDLGGENIHRAWMSSLHLPLFAYLFTGSFWHFFIQISVQYLYINNVFYSRMQESVAFMTVDSYSTALLHSTNRTFIYNVTFVILTHIIMEKAFRRIISLEQKKTEFEGQKSFLLSFSHELRNLINSLSGNIKLASLVDNISPRLKELLLNAEVCGEVLLHLVNNILDTGKIEIGELEINPAPTRIYDTLEKTWGVCAELIKRQNLHGRMKINKSLPKTLKVDQYRLTQIFLNLVGNSIKFTDNGSIEINISWLDSEDQVAEKCFMPYPFNEADDHDEGLFEKQRSFSFLDENILMLDLVTRKISPSRLRQDFIPTNRKRGVLKIVVSDTGCGMSEEETKRLFKRFSQVSSDPSKRKLGTGLGLFITKQLCEKMQGEIRVFSKKNKGTSFIACIPIDVIPEEEHPESLWDLDFLRTFVKEQKLKAMIVDDISFNHTILSSFFDKLGIEVIAIAVNGLEAYEKYVELAQKGKPVNIVAMDLDMPVMNGKEATRKIRQFEMNKGHEKCFLPIVSGNCTESEIEECLSPNGTIKADSFMKKPAIMDDLLKIIGHHFIQTRRNISQ